MRVKGFSKFSKTEKIKWLAEHFCEDATSAERDFAAWQHPEPAVQNVLDGFAENTVANYALPYCIAPNFLINGKTYAVPMVTEESSVVAAASSAAKFWLTRGGFHAKVLGTVKLGQVHFYWPGDPEKLRTIFPDLKAQLLGSCSDLAANMQERGGGVLDIELLSFENIEPEYYQLRASFETCDSMGANFINSVLERFADKLEDFFTHHPGLTDLERDVEVLMSILSNYTPDCLVRAWVECPIDSFAKLAASQGMDADTLAQRFARAVSIAQIDRYRATTHNKGIYNGIDAVALATGNDFRAIEACGHTYASRSGQYRSLSTCTVRDGVFRFELEIPLALGTVGGLTALHPLAKRSLEILGNPSAPELMCITAAVGLAQNFGALRSLVTTGIQQGHMKMHLTNILNQLGANAEQAAAALDFFQNQTVSFSAVGGFLAGRRG